MALPFLAEFGWEPLILKIDPQEQSGIRDPALEASVPPGTRVWQAGCIPRRWTQWFGLNNVGIRSLGHIARLGNELIRRERPDVVFLSTTMFPLFALGRYWLRKHGIPYILDFQDPWRAGKFAHTAQRTWKGVASEALAAMLEPYAVKRAAHVVCVSPGYGEALTGSYGIDGTRISILPFGGPVHDFDLLSRMQIAPAFPSGDGNEHWV
jgi:glycosyltransferase involved in cell wall biosynthesis